MKTITKTIYKADRVWFDIKDQKVIGDMCSTFLDSDESRTTLLDSLVEDIRYGIGYEVKEEQLYKIDDPEQVCIYEILKGEIEYELEDDDDFYEGMVHHGEPKDGWSVIGEIAACSSSYAEKIGMEESNFVNIEYYV